MSLESLRRSFLQPPDEFTPIPFWFWNDELDEAELRRQIRDFRDHGVMGFVIHPRKGLPRSIPYLSERYLHFVRVAVAEAAALNMQVVLYDEAMYPSGSAHGMVVAENPAWASRCLTMAESAADVPAEKEIVAVCAAQVEGERVEGKKAEDLSPVVAVEGVYRCPADGRTLLVFREGFSGGTIRGVHEQEDDGEPLAPPSADLLNPEAVRAFIRLTHERYYEALKAEFGRTIVAMFTDEPDITGRNARRGGKAWTTGFLAEFGDATDLPALWLDVGERTEEIRSRYRRAINRRMKKTYYGQLADWCAAHGIALTGHPAKSWDMGLLEPFQIPGQDVVWRCVAPENGIHSAESVVAKCSADAARHLGRRRNGNECFGCCGPKGVQWAFTLDEMKWYMDYLFVRGVNLLYPHAFFYSLRDGRGGERPPDVGPNNVWWPMYGQIATYIKRLSWLMTDSVNQARVAVLCEEDHLPWRSVAALYENQIEFNYLELARLPECTLVDGALCIQQQRYTHVLCGEAAPDALPRDAVVTPPAPDLRVTHGVKDGMHFYLLVNEGETPIVGQLRTSVTGAAEWWNPWQGTTCVANADAQGSFFLHLERRESLILCINPQKPATCAARQERKVPTVERPLAGQRWQLTRLSDGETHEITADAQGCLPGWETFWPDDSGWVAYETELSLAEDAELSLGEVSALVRVLADDREVGWKGWSPYVFDLPAGCRTLRVEVCNTLANRMEGKAWPSGIMGAVTLRQVR